METTSFFMAGYLAVAIVLFAYISNLQSKIKKLESQIQDLKK